MTQLSKSAYISKYGSTGTDLPDNNTGDIDAEIAREWGQNNADSLMFLDENFVDEDDMASNSATKAPSQQSVKAYYDLARFNRQTASYILALADLGKTVEMNVGSANTLTVPPNSDVAFAIGSQIFVTQYGAGQTTIQAGTGVTIRSQSSFLKIAAQYGGVTLVKVGTNEWYCFGLLSA